VPLGWVGVVGRYAPSPLLPSGPLQKLLAVVLLAASVLASPGRAGEESESEIVEAWIAARLRGADVPSLTRRLPGMTVDRAYAVQGSVVERLVASGDRYVGYKVGFTSAGARERFGVASPAHGRLLASMQVEPAAAIDTAGFSRVFVEVEIAFTIGRRVEVVGDDPQNLRAHVATVHPALELPDLRFARDVPLGLADFVADGVGAHRFVLGEGRVLGELDLASVTSVLERDGQVIGRGRGGDAMGDPLRALQWLARDLASRGRSLEPGDVVLTGALGAVQVLAPGEAAGRYRARIEGIGEVETRLR
jgi:2-keto-4-pentenoate hydratase